MGGGGGDKPPKCTDRKKRNLVHVTYMRERCTSETYRPVFSHMAWHYINDTIGQKTNIEKIYAYASERGASELGKCSHFYF